MHIADSLTSVFVFICTVLFGAKLFRFSLRQYWLPLVAAALVIAIFNLITGRIMGWNTPRPFISLLLEAAMIHMILRISKWNALILSFLSLITYTLLLGLSMFLYHTLTGTTYHDIFYDDQKDNWTQIVAGIMLCILIIIMSRYRLGFTLNSKSQGIQHGWRARKNFTVVLLLSIFIFSVAYYAVTTIIYFGRP